MTEPVEAYADRIYATRRRRRCPAPYTDSDGVTDSAVIEQAKTREARPN